MMYLETLKKPKIFEPLRKNFFPKKTPKNGDFFNFYQKNFFLEFQKNLKITQKRSKYVFRMF